MACLEIGRLAAALERIALLDEADGHELTVREAFRAVGSESIRLKSNPVQSDAMPISISTAGEV